jgi:hypothetical protein
VTTKLERFTLMAREEPHLRFTSLMGLLFDPAGLLDELRATGRTQGAWSRWDQEGSYMMSIPSLGGRLKLGAGWFNTPSPTAPSRVPNRRMAEILRHRRETRRQTDKANICLNDGKAPAYSPAQLSIEATHDSAPTPGVKLELYTITLCHRKAVLLVVHNRLFA